MIRIGVIGTGRITRRFMPEAKTVEGLSLAAVYNPHIESARDFANIYGVPFFTDCLEEFLEQVDAVYVASPHETHYEYVKAALDRKRHVLCEKPMALSVSQAEELFALADQAGCVLMEAIKTAYCPGFLAMMETAKSGVIGRIMDVEACFSKLTATNTRELRGMEWGGSFIELGTHPMLPVFKLLGTDYQEVRFRTLKAPSGLDSYTKADFLYENAMATATAGLLVKTEGQLVISGTKGYILAKSPWWLTKEFEVRFEDASVRKTYTYEYAEAGLRYEIQGFVRAIGGEAAAQVTRAESIAMARVMEQFQEYRGRRGFGPEGRPLNIWAHRGMSFSYPENTLPAFEAAARLPGLAGIETDVQMTRDGELVIIHDEKVDRTTDGTGAVKDFSLEELKNLKIRWKDDESCAIPTLREVLRLLKPVCRERGLLLNLELKNSIERYEGMEEKVLAAVAEEEMEEYVWYSSFLPDSMALLRQLDPKVKTGVLAVSMEDCLREAERVKADAVHPYVGGLNAPPPPGRDMPVRAWNGEELLFGQQGRFREKNLRQFAAYGVTDVFTNVPERYLVIG